MAARKILYIKEGFSEEAIFEQTLKRLKKSKTGNMRPIRRLLK